MESRADLEAQLIKDLQVNLTGLTYGALGFQPAKKSTIMPNLRKISPNGGTAMRDSILVGTEMMLHLHEILTQLGTANYWHFVHVIITDGEDSGSINTLETTAVMIAALGQTIGDQFLKTVFIGVEVEQNQQAIREIAALVALGDKFTDFHKVSATNLDAIFDKIRISIGLKRTVVGVQVENEAMIGVRDQLILGAEKGNYVVLFNLDMSGSMNGRRWNSVLQSVNGFLNYLGPNDLVAGLVFNNNVTLVTAPEGPRVLEKTDFNKVLKEMMDARQPAQNNYNSYNPRTRAYSYSRPMPREENSSAKNCCICLLVCVVVIFILNHI